MDMYLSLAIGIILTEAARGFEIANWNGPWDGKGFKRLLGKAQGLIHEMTTEMRFWCFEPRWTLQRTFLLETRTCPWSALPAPALHMIDVV